MADKLAAFVKSLAEDQNQLDAFQKDSEGAMDRAGLSNAEKVLVRHGNQELILEAIGGKAAGALFIVRIFRAAV
ncbi:MAG: hypothetical protein AABO58_04855 [Acidobacteriota bacterium]